MATPAGSAGWVRLLLDVHHSRIAAERLRSAGFDVVAAAENPVLARLADEELLRVAASEGRALVTENVGDFDRIVRAWAATGDHHAGVVFSSPRRFHRGSAAYPTNLIRSLEAILGDPPRQEHDWIHWLV